MMSTRSSKFSSQFSANNPQRLSYVPATTQRPRSNELKKSPYQVAQQVKFLHLQAEVESLLQQLQFLNQQRLDADSRNVAATRE